MTIIRVIFAEEAREPLIGETAALVQPRATLIVGSSDSGVRLYTIRSVGLECHDDTLDVVVGYSFPAPQHVAFKYWTDCGSFEIIAAVYDPAPDASVPDRVDRSVPLAVESSDGGTLANPEAETVRAATARRNADA